MDDSLGFCSDFSLLSCLTRLWRLKSLVSFAAEIYTKSSQSFQFLAQSLSLIFRNLSDSCAELFPEVLPLTTPNKEIDREIKTESARVRERERARERS